VDIFEFVAGFYVVLAGLGVTLLLRSVGQMLESRERIDFYWVHGAWIAFVFLMHVNSWFTLWAYNDLQQWTVAQLLLLVGSPLFLYLASHVIVPEIAEHEDRRHDMRAYFFERFRLLLGLLVLAVISTLLSEYLLLEQRIFSLNNIARLVVLLVFILGLLTERPRIHAGIATFLLLVAVGSLARLNETIS
jgi:hypothetical protein